MNIRDVLQDELSSGGVVDAFLDQVLTFASSYLPNSPLPGWEVSVTPDVLEIEPGGTANTTLLVRAETPGALAIAVRAIDRNDVRRYGVSTVIVVERDPDGAMSVMFTDDDEGAL